IIGRKEEFKYGPRIIDIDLLFFNNLVINKPLIQIPHPQIPHRKFVLKPLSEIAPLLIHPINNTPIITLLKNCSDNGLVRKLNDNSLKKYIN
ncbi:MAG: 2-amino-4-hydroxy-6-hydroxymethyldihydropteridine diphosphokinase, partial [Chitinophagaceae bacterium]|nr:2-amino-4-hydroxy-6-hydroxymethyldihydropteridine diphosphokinase [Chitinophagaceae bacterium]